MLEIVDQGDLLPIEQRVLFAEEQALEPLRRAVLLHHNTDARLIAAAERHDDTRPRHSLFGQRGRHEIGIELIKLKGGVVERHLYSPVRAHRI